MKNNEMDEEQDQESNETNEIEDSNPPSETRGLLLESTRLDRLNRWRSRDKIALIIAISGFLVAFLVLFTGGINYSGPIGKYGGTFFQHFQEMMGLDSGDKFNNFLLFTWIFIPILGVIIGVLGLAVSKSKDQRGKVAINVLVIILAVPSYLVLLASMTTIYNLRLLRAVIL